MSPLTSKKSTQQTQRGTGKNHPSSGAQSQPLKPLRPGMRGWAGRGRGEAFYVQATDEYCGTTVQVYGLWPFAAGSGTPMVGVPLGRHITTGATVCCDPISWFQRAKLISNPSAFILGKPGLGKSTVVRRMVTGLSGYGVIPLVLGDLKPDYVDLVEALGGQVIRLGRGRGHLNVLDPGEATAAAERLTGAAREEVLADSHGRRLTMLSALLTVVRKQPPTDREEAILDRALRVLDRTHEGVPVLSDLLRVIQDAPTEVRAVALDRGDDARYKEITENLEASLIGLVDGGQLGEIFSRQTTVTMKRDRPVVFDVSSIPDSEPDLQAAVLLACWSAGFGSINVANALADAGLEPRRHYFVVMDELWRALRAGHGMVICGGLPGAEMPMLTQALPFSREEQSLMTGWQDPPAWDPESNEELPPPGRGKFLIKVGGRPGIPVEVILTEAERSINDTNKLWHQQSRIGTREA